MHPAFSKRSVVILQEVVELFQQACLIPAVLHVKIYFSFFFSPSLISCSEMNSKLQQAQTNSQELQNGGCVSGVRRKRRGFWSHAMKEQLGVTLGGIKPWRRFVPGFIGETWLRRFKNI